jgi:hypothetical protein
MYFDMHLVITINSDVNLYVLLNSSPSINSGHSELRETENRVIRHRFIDFRMWVKGADITG